MKKIFDKVREWTGKQIPDKAIEMVLEVFAESDIYFPSDFTISLTKEQMQDAKKANIELNEKTKALFMELNHDNWGDDEVANENLATIIFGLVLTANGDTLNKEVKDKIKIVPFDNKGGKADVDFAKNIEYPISLKRTTDVKEYLDTKVTHPFPEVMFEDIRHTKKFTDIPWGVLTHLVSYYHAYNGDVTAKDMLGYVKRKMLKEVPLNKRGANIKKTTTPVGKPILKDHTEVEVKKYKLYMELTNDEVERLGEKLNWRKDGYFLDGYHSVVYEGDIEGDEYIANDGVSVKERNLEKVKEAMKEVGLDRIDKVEEFKTTEYIKEVKKAKNGANVGFGNWQKVYDRVREWAGEEITNDEIKAVIDTLSEDDINFPEDFTIEHKEQQNEEADYQAHQEAIADKSVELATKVVVSQSSIHDKVGVDSSMQVINDIVWALVMMADGDDLTNLIDLEMKNGGNLEDKTEVSVTEFNKYFMRNYGFISHSLTNKQLEKFLNQDVIKRVSLSKKADYFQDYLLANGLADDVQMMAGGNIQSIEKKVAEVNELIEMGNKNNVSVTDTSSTWQSPMKYKPFVYKNGILYENYDELDLYLYSKTGDRKWRIVKHKYTKSGDGVDTQKEVLNNVAKMYRKELKYYADYDYYLLRTKGKMMSGGSIDNENKLMVANNNKQLRHHTEELNEALENANHIPAWVVAKVNRSASDLSDATHYLEGVNSKYANGGGVGDRTIAFFHNKYGHALPQVITKNGLNFTIELEKLPKHLKDKLYGYNGVITISEQEAKDLYKAKYRSMSEVGESTLKNIFEDKMANGGGVENIKSKINELYSKSNFINDSFNWKLKLLEMLQDRSIEAYNIYQSLTKEQKEEVLQEQYEVDNDMGSDGDGNIKTTKENLKILLNGAKNGNKYSNGGNMQGFNYEIGGL